MPGVKGRSGRHKLPKELKVIRGTYQKCRDNPNEPKPDEGIPKPMKGMLSKEERKHFDRLAKILSKMKVITLADVITLEIYAQTLDLYYNALVNVRNQGLTIEYNGKNGSTIRIKNPWLSILNEARKTVISLISRFGLDPSSRASLNIIHEDNHHPSVYDDL